MSNKFLILFFSLTNSLVFGQNKIPKDITVRIDHVLNKMSLEEKIGQTCQITLDAVLKRNNAGVVIEPIEIDTMKLNEAIIKYHIGSILNVNSHSLSMDEWKKIINSVHKPFKDKQSKIPIIYGIDAIHGANYTKGATLFPHEIGLAASWNPTLAKKFAEIAAYETRASGIHWNFSPVLDIGRQPLWSRFFETLGEDPFLASEMGTSIVNGYQGDGNIIDKDHVAACLKHFVGYSNPLSGRDRTPAWIPDKFMKEIYLPPFKKAVENGALTLMINSGDVNGIPGHMNYELLTKTLKNEWGFKGFTVSDWEDFEFLHSVHNTADGIFDAIVKGFNAGVDMSMVPYAPQYKGYCDNMLRAVKEGKISKKRLDDAIRRILYVKLKLGLFDENLIPESDYKNFGSDNHKKIALEAASESITLLKNNNQILPLKKDKKVLVAGPTSNNLIFQNGSWTYTWQGVDTAYTTPSRLNIRQAVESYIGANNTLFSQGAELFIKDGFEHSKSLDTSDFISKASNADIILLCLGEMPATEKPGDIRSLDLTEEQIALAKLAFSTKKPVVLILSQGRPRIIREIVDGAEAIVQTYLPGDFGPEALMKLLYGEIDFSGRLPYTYPKYNGIVEHYDHPKSVDRSKSGAFDAYDPQWNFGFGLSYAKVDYSNFSINKNTLNSKDSIIVNVTLTNKSNLETKEVVQVYLTDHTASVVPAGKKLIAFDKVFLGPKDQKTVSFTIKEKLLNFVDSKGNFISEPGKFTLSIASDKKEFILVK